MKKHITFILIINFILILLVGCSEATSSISSEEAFTPSLNTLETSDTDENTSSEDEEETFLTVTANEIPYFEDNSITFTDKFNFELPFVVYCSDETFDKIIDVPGISLSANTITYEITSVSSSESAIDGYIDITILVNSSFSFLLYENDAMYDNSLYSYSIHRAEFELADYYTGVHFPNRTYDQSAEDTLIPYLEIKDSTFAISENATSKWNYESHNWKIIERDPYIYELPVSGTITDTYVIHAPSDYDGLVLCIDTNGLEEFTQKDLDAFKDLKINTNSVSFVLDDMNKDTIMAIRVSDLL